MKASELRIGNYLQAPLGEIMRVAQIGHEANPDFIFCKGEDGSFGQNGFEPIPLTEEWLVRLGFESNPYQDRYENKAIHVECNKTKGYTELWIERMPHIKYVHQLQNLYFALTGEELTTTPIQ